MNAELHRIIVQYQDTVKKLFPRVAAHLNVQLPITDRQWAVINAKQRGETPDGIKYFKHGYGIRMYDGNVEVDFDLGDKSQIDGFDAGRLSDFVEMNHIETSLKTWDAIGAAIKEAESAGELIFSGYLLYYIK